VNGSQSKTRSLNLPTLVNEGQYKVLIFDAFILLGEELGEHYRAKLEPIYGKNWIVDLARQRNDSPYNLIDPGWVLKEPLRNSSSPTRVTLPKGQGFYNQVSLLAKARNAYFHNQGSGSTQAILGTMQLLLDFSLSIPLDFCANEYAEAIKRINKLSAGEQFLGAEQGLERIENLEEQVANLEEVANQNKRDIQIREQLLESALDDIAVREEALQELRAKVGGQDEEIIKARADQEIAIKLAEELRIEYETKVAQLAEKEGMERQYKELLRTLVESNTVESLKSKEAKNTKAKAKNLKPGSVWVGEKGSRRLTLSVNFRELYDTKTGVLLSELHGAVATQLASQWLEIKPQGGRVFVDEEGCATAYRGEDLIFLGVVGFKL
jgi:hypothetical protein